LMRGFYTDVVAYILGPRWAVVHHCWCEWPTMVVFIAVANDVSETWNPSIVQYVHLFLIAHEVRMMGSHLIVPLQAHLRRMVGRLTWHLKQSHYWTVHLEFWVQIPWG
jgi:hypothetical protein